MLNEDLSLSQDVLMRNIQFYLLEKNRDPEVISNFSVGYCRGITWLWLYAKWLGTQPKEDVSKERDDYDWFIRTMKLINGWDRIREFTKKEVEDVERFFSIISYQQGYLDYFTQIKDTKGRTPQKEYSFSSLLTLEQLKRLLSIIIKDGKLVDISSGFHATGLFFKGGIFYYFDPNSEAGEFQTTSIDKLAEKIFHATCRGCSGRDSRKTLRKTLYEFSFDIYSFDEEPAKYPSQVDLLDWFKVKENPEIASNKFTAKYTGLTYALDEDDLESAEYFIRLGFNVNTPVTFEPGISEDRRRIIKGHLSIEGATPIMFRAAYYDDSKIFKMLVKKGANLNAQDASGNTALMCFTKEGNIIAVKELLKAGADPNIQNKNGDTALVLAAQYGENEIAIELLRARADYTIPNKTNSTALMYAAKYGNTTLVTELVNIDASYINTKNNPCMNALMYAKTRNYYKIVGLLIQRGALDENEVMTDEEKQKALIQAAKELDLNTIQYFLKQGVDPNAEHEIEEGVRTTALDQILKEERGAFANGADRTKIVHLLLENGARPDSIKEENRTKALIFAAQIGDARLAKSLLELRADPNMPDSYLGATALMWAILRNHYDVVDVLLKHSDIDFTRQKARFSTSSIQKQTYYTPIEIAIKGDRSRILKRLLLDPRIDTAKIIAHSDLPFRDIIVYKTMYPLKLAVLNGNIESIKILLLREMRSFIFIKSVSTLLLTILTIPTVLAMPFLIVLFVPDLLPVLLLAALISVLGIIFPPIRKFITELIKDKYDRTKYNFIAIYLVTFAFIQKNAKRIYDKLTHTRSTPTASKPVTSQTVMRQSPTTSNVMTKLTNLLKRITGISPSVTKDTKVSTSGYNFFGFFKKQRSTETNLPRQEQKDKVAADKEEPGLTKRKRTS